VGRSVWAGRVRLLRISGSSNTKEYYDGPFLYVGGKMYDLNSLLVSNNGYTITKPIGINDFRGDRRGGDPCRG
jgi:hypothetical protein